MTTVFDIYAILMLKGVGMQTLVSVLEQIQPLRCQKKGKASREGAYERKEVVLPGVLYAAPKQKARRSLKNTKRRLP